MSPTPKRGPASDLLPAIPEDGSTIHLPPAIPARAKHRPNPLITSWLSDPPRSSFNSSPPAYTESVASPAFSEDPREKTNPLRDNRFIARRGGWLRLCLIVLSLILCIVGLVVGLVVGLKKKHSNNSGTSSSEQDTTFPAGSYSIQTYLSTVNTNCTTNPATWTCYPYSTYSQDASASAAEFDWIISPSSPSATDYTISSSNPFSITFSNSTLHLLDSGLSTERYSFSFQMQKQVIPSSAITSDNSQSTCFYNSGIFEASLYTKMPKLYPASGDTNTTTSGKDFAPWPYAVFVEEVAASGTNQPDCFDASGNSVGDFVVSSGESCGCIYQNYDA